MALLVGTQELRPVLDFFDGLSPDEPRFRWDRLVILNLLLMSFIKAYGYPMQKSKLDFPRTLQQLVHPEAGPKLVARLRHLGLETHAALSPLKAAVGYGEAAHSPRPHGAASSS
jgi:hypothetical protein